MTHTPQGASRLAYPATLAMLALALAFPIGLMIGNPTLMFERGWEQYVGTAIYVWAVLTLGVELRRLWSNERALREGPTWLESPAGGAAAGVAGTIAEDERRIVPARLRQLALHAGSDANPTLDQLMQLNQEASGLDQEQASGRLTLTRYILYLLPVIGFIGTVEGISKALINISRVLPMVKDLDGFLQNLTSVTAALQIAFDSTLLALFLSAALMLVQTLVIRRSEDLLARVDRWVVEHVLPRFAGAQESGARADAVTEVLAPLVERLEQRLADHAGRTAEALADLAVRFEAGLGLGPHVVRFAEAIDPLPAAVSGFQRGAETIGRLGDELEAIGESGEALRRGAASLARIEAALAASAGPDEQLLEIKRGIDRTCAAIESLSSAWAHSLERSSRAAQDQLARTLHSLKDALDLLNVSMEQGNALYRSIVKKMLPVYHGPQEEQAA